ncbi:hypothetical protein [Helicobacter cetorum]|nr:hypothetical protein [Helicobacter cetorum]
MFKNKYKKWRHSLILSLLCVGSLMAEDDGFFTGITYQTSLAIEKVDNPGLVASQNASNYIRG